MDELVLAFVKPPLQEGQINMRADSLLSQGSEAGNTNSVGGAINNNYSVAIIRRFDFSSKLQRMSVITKNFIDHSFRAYVKGSPEKIHELCKPESIPDNYEEIL